jgi:hypothetical protein
VGLLQAHLPAAWPGHAHSKSLPVSQLLTSDWPAQLTPWLSRRNEKTPQRDKVRGMVRKGKEPGFCGIAEPPPSSHLACLHSQWPFSRLRRLPVPLDKDPDTFSGKVRLTYSEHKVQSYQSRSARAFSLTERVACGFCSLGACTSLLLWQKADMVPGIPLLEGAICTGTVLLASSGTAGPGLWP